jgi:hypothetical protein
MLSTRWYKSRLVGSPLTDPDSPHSMFMCCLFQSLLGSRHCGHYSCSVLCFCSNRSSSSATGIKSSSRWSRECILWLDLIGIGDHNFDAFVGASFPSSALSILPHRSASCYVFPVCVPWVASAHLSLAWQQNRDAAAAGALARVH